MYRLSVRGNLSIKHIISSFSRTSEICFFVKSLLLKVINLWSEVKSKVLSSINPFCDTEIFIILLFLLPAAIIFFHTGIISFESKDNNPKSSLLLIISQASLIVINPLVVKTFVSPEKHVIPPSSVTIAADFCIATTISGLVISVTRTSPFWILGKSFIEFIILTIPTPIPGLAPNPDNKIVPEISVFLICPFVVIGLDCTIYILLFSTQNSISCGFL